jgi:cation diffusion facilitator family transporter
LTATGYADLSIFETVAPPRFRLSFSEPDASRLRIPVLETVRFDGQHQTFSFEDRGEYWESVEEIPEPHAFTVLLKLPGDEHELLFVKGAQGHHEASSAALRDNSMRSAYVHVIADAVVSVLAITGLLLARSFGWLWMDPLGGLIGALVIANGSYGLLRDTGGILLDISPDPTMTEKLRSTIERAGDRLIDLHLWRLGPGHLGAVISVVTGNNRDAAFYRSRLSTFTSLSHVTVEVMQAAR